MSFLQQFEFKAMFLEEDFVEQNTFHERKTTKETEKRFEKGECSRQVEHTNIEDLLSIIMASNEALNWKMEKLLVEAEGIKNG
uniref:Uncharacterized protein n=1 Tax=Cucumis sativus TaxID=3659 RepID=A0A0A0K3B0_CUCSA